jgi:hypothetical protein
MYECFHLSSLIVKSPFKKIVKHILWVKYENKALRILLIMGKCGHFLKAS